MLKVSQRNFAIIILAFIWLFMGEALASVVAMSVCAYFNPIAKIGETKLNVINEKLDKLIRASPRAVSIEQA